MAPTRRPHHCHRINCRHRGKRRRFLTVPAVVALIQLLGAFLRLFSG